MREKLLKTFYRMMPFNLQGNCNVPLSRNGIKISCIINFYGRLDVLSGILASLTEQDFPVPLFEVVLIEDNGGTAAGQEIADRFSSILQVVYSPLDKNYGAMGYSRNLGLLISKGEFVLFLDDDTVLLQKDFLSRLVDEFLSAGADSVIPRGSVSYCLRERRYDYHEPYFPTSRCTAYRREALTDLHGFVSAMVGQEDVEFAIRFIAAGKCFHRSSKLNYLHPPLLVNNLKKPAAVGMSFFKLRRRYPFIIWILLLINGCRYLLLCLFPLKMKWKMQGKFSLGFLFGIFYSLRGKKVAYSDDPPVIR